MMMEETLKRALEALLFASDEPLSVKRLSDLLHTSQDQVRATLEDMGRDFEHSRGLIVSSVAGGFRLETHPDQYERVAGLILEKRNQRLSQAALETLSLVAYKQPITAIEIAENRQVSSVSAVLKTLLERKLVKMVGRKKVLGRPMMYGTTAQFLVEFGLDSLKDLPKLEDFQETPAGGASHAAPT
jgi:segregation and condensation protein B